MLERSDILDPAQAPFGKPTSRITTPNIFDLVVVEDIPISPENYRALPYKSPHRDYANNRLVLVWQGPVKAANNQINVRRVYASDDDAPENWFNYAIKYSGDATTNPIYIRSYNNILRENYVAGVPGTPLTAVVKLAITNRGSNYSNTPVPVVTITGGGGTGATAAAIVSPDGEIIGLQLLTEGSGYTSNPTVNITHPDGTGAVAIAVIQPPGAVLIKEELTKIDDAQLDSIFVRVNRIYEVLPGPWIPYSRWDDELGPIQGLKRAVLFTNPPQAAISDVTSKTTYEARDGSSIVAMEQIETWGRDPYSKRFAIEVTDPTPEKFKTDVPTVTQSDVEPGRPALPVLGESELHRSSEEVNKFWTRESVTRREPPKYPRELSDFELGGIHTHGSEFGGVLETKHRLDNKPQTVEEGFDILASKVEALGRGLTWRRTQRLYAGGKGIGPYLELIDGGEGYVDDPAVIFAGGDSGSGAAGAASVTETPIAPTDIDPGGVFTRTFVSNGDDQGVFTFIGKRYNSGTWRNPADAGNIVISAKSHPSYPVSQAALNGLTDHALGTDATVVPTSGGGHYIMIDLGPGRTLKANKITLRLNTPGGVIMTTCRIYGFNKFGVAPTDIGSGIALPQTAGAWTGGALNNAVGYRYFWIFGLDAQISSNPETWPALRLAEVEMYGELTIAPDVQLDYAYNGDANGAFHYLGTRGGNGVWRNPQTAGDIAITLPYDALEFGTLDSMVDREPSNTYLVNRDHSEIWFDLGANRSLLLTTLNFRQRADYGSSMTQTSVQGSADGVTWEEFQHFNVSGVASAWTKVDITAFTKYYRFFRLIIPVGKSFHSIGELELYGSLRLNAAGSAESPGFSVTGVQITAQGSGYAKPPQVVFSGGGPGTGAAATAVVENGKIVRVDMIAAGSHYTSAPTVEFVVGSGGSGATADATAAGGVVTALNVLTGGSGYTEPPKVKIVSATGTGASGTAVLTGDVVTSITLNSGGSGYVLPPTVVLYPTTDPEADAEIGFDLDSITLNNGGSGYSSPPAVHISGDGDNPATAVAILGFPVASVLVEDPGAGYLSDPGVVFTGDGTGAAGTAHRAFDVASTNVTAGGSGYLTEPVVQVAGGGGSDAQFQALIGRMLLRIDMAAAGSGYTSDPTVVITGDGTGAAAHVVRSFAVASIAVSAGGTGYTVAPTIVIPVPTGANGRRATAHAVLTGGAVTSIVIDDPGQGYLTAPTATMTGGDGTGATIGAVTLASGGAIDSIVIDTAGTGFSEAPVISFTGGAGTGAAASAILDTSTAGAIVKVKILNAGKDYTTAPTLTILPGTSGGTGATATAALSTTGKIKSVTLTTPGTGYTVEPTVSFTGGGGSGAGGKGALAATGAIKAVNLISVGDGFRAGAQVTFSGGGGSGAIATVVPSTCGKVAKVTLTKAGGPFTIPPLVSFIGGQSPLCPSANKGWSALPPLSVPRANHTTTLLPNGRILVVGGLNNNQSLPANRYLKSAEIFNPATNTWSPAADMSVARYEHGAQLLADGRVLVFSGLNKQVSAGATNDTAEIYDPVTNTWSAAGAMAAADDDWFSGQFTWSCKLLDGRIFVVRGYRGPTGTNQVQIYDPTTDTWTVAAPIATVFSAASNNTTYSWWPVVTLPNGNVLAVFAHPAAFPNTDARYALYDPTTDTWTASTIVGTPWRQLHFAVLLPNNLVYVSSGFPWTGTPAETPLLYDYLTDTWTPTGAAVSVRRYNQGYCLDATAKLFMAGGGDLSGINIPEKKWVEIYNPTANTHADLAKDMITARRYQGQLLLADGRIIVIGGLTTGDLSTALVEAYGYDPRSAAALYRLGSSWPTLREEHTDPTEKIIILIDKTIVVPETPLPAGFSEKFPLDIYRSIQIVSKVNLQSLPAPEVYDTTQHVQFPPLLLSLYPIWDTNRAQATAGGINTGTQRGSVSASVQVVGSIVVTKLDGFRGAALATVERQFFFGPPPRDLVPEPTIIRPSSGTAITVTTRNSSSRSGLTYSATGNSNPAGNDFASYAKSSGSSGVTTQVVDLHDVLSAGIQRKDLFNANNSSFADALNVQVGASGSFTVDLPASTPTALIAGKTILAQVLVEKWRFGLYVRTLVRVTIPALP